MSRLSELILAISDRGGLASALTDCRKSFSIPTVSSGRRVLTVGNRNRQSGLNPHGNGTRAEKEKRV